MTYPRKSKDRFNLVQLTRRMVVGNLESARAKRGASPFELTTSVVRETLKTYLKGVPPASPNVAEGVREVARGAMLGLFTKYLNVPGGAEAILQGAAEMALLLQLDPNAVKMWAIQGIAEASRTVPNVHIALIQNDIDRSSVDGGRLFREVLERRHLL